MRAKISREANMKIKLLVVLVVLVLGSLLLPAGCRHRIEATKARLCPSCLCRPALSCRILSGQS